MKAWPRIVTLLALGAVIVFLGVIYGYRLGLWDLGVVFGWLRPMIPVLGIAAVLALAAAVALLLRRSFFASVAALVVGLSAASFAYLPIWMRGEANKVPAIHDITTDWVSPPEFVATARERGPDDNPAAYDSEQTEAQLSAFPEIQPLVMPQPLPEAYAIALEALKAEGLRIVEAAPSEGRIEATETVPLFGFKDDVVVRLRNAHNIATVVDIRSKSRVGRSDLGFNARRIESLLQRMEEAGGRLEAPSEETEGMTI